MTGANGNAQMRGHLGVGTATTCDDKLDITPILERVKAALLAGQSIRLIDYMPEERQEIIGAIAALRDQLPIVARWSAVRESFLSETRLRALRYLIPGEFLREGVDHAR